MIGLEYICNLYNIQYKEIAEMLGISKQTINSWVTGRRKIPRKYLPSISKKFDISEEYFQKEINDVDKLIIQKLKLENELKPSVVDYELQFMVGENADLIEKPIYDKVEINDIEFDIKKTKILYDLKNIINNAHNDYELQIYEQIVLLFKEYGNKRILGYTIDAVSHYYDVLPYWVGEPESQDFVDEFIKLAQKYDE